MLLIPAIRIKNGKCPAAAERSARNQTQLDDPVEVAKSWVAAGARRLHVTDLDSVVSGKADNARIVHNIVNACLEVPVQVSGALRNDATVESYFSAGAEYVVLDTKSASTPHFINDLCLEYPGHILAALATVAGKVVAGGWSKLAQQSVLGVAEHFQREGVAAILCSEQNGGFDIEAVMSLAQTMTVPVLLSGGLNSIEDIRRLCKADAGLSGAVLEAGFAGGAPDFAKAQKLADSLSTSA
ncbi:MAG: HisA/HisF-related TIM barrel protein [Gammaproteobacteria bacterium]